MNAEQDIKVYKAIMPELMATEFYLGTVYYAFYFTKAEYRATCTEAFPFNPFDKVICELLKVEESLSFNEIGDILGLNVYESESKQKYLDIAEREILTEAIQTLSSDDFGRMVETGDMHMSKCRLTATGREYAEKKSKFRVTENKPFTIYFDHTTKNHQLAKENFEFAKGTTISTEFDISFANEATLKEIAGVQVPEIYNPEKQHSFANPVLVCKETFEIELPVAVTINAQNNTTRFFCLDKKYKSIQEHFTNWLTNSPIQKKEILEALEMNGSVSQLHIPSSFFDLFSERALLDAKMELLKQDLIDPVLFLHSMAELIEPSASTTLYLTLPTINHSVTNSIIQSIQKSESSESRFFIVLPNHTEENQDSVKALFDLASSLRNLYCMQRPVRSFFLGLKTDSSSNYYSIGTTIMGDYKKDLIQKSQWDDRSERTEVYLLEQFCEESALDLCSAVTQIINEDLDDHVPTDRIKELEDMKFELHPFRSVNAHSKTVLATMELIDRFVTDLTTKLRNTIELQLSMIEQEISGEPNEKTIHHSQELFSQLNQEIISSNNSLQKRAIEVENLITAKKKAFEESKKVYHIILDTNALINEPKILDLIDRKHKIIIAAKVLDELDNFKKKPELQKAAAECISLIFRDSFKNIRRAKANLKLLPPDFSRKSPDNLILAVALGYVNKDGVLVTDDKGLVEKCKTVNVKTLSLASFKSKFIPSK